MACQPLLLLPNYLSAPKQSATISPTLLTSCKLPIELKPLSAPEKQDWERIKRFPKKGEAVEMEPSSTLQSIDASTLTPVVRQALQRDKLQILDWQVSQLSGGAGNPVSVGLYRFEGIGQDREERFAWSVILKIIQSPANVGEVNLGEGDDQTHWNYWKRELFIYQSNFLETLPEGMAAPQCYATGQQPGNIAWLWLEDVIDAFEGVWSLERCALTARHLGRLNGSYLSKSPWTAFPWLGKHLTRQWVQILAPDWQAIPWEHPRVLNRYPRPELNPFRRMLLDNVRFLAKLDLLPKTVCHGDTYPTNFKARFLSGGKEQTVALDWALAGIAPLGDDLGQFAFGAYMNLKEADPTDVDQALFESYLDGLRDTGCRVDPQQVRFGYTASAALRVGLFQLVLLGEELKQNETATKQTVEHSVEHDCFEVVMANEAYELLEAIR